MIYDINLIPKSYRKISREALFVITLGFVCCVALTTFFGIYVPLQEKKELSSLIKEEESELLSFTDMEVEYIHLLNQVDEISNSALTLETIKNSNLKMTQTLHDLEESIPKNIKVKGITLGDGILMIEGSSPTYREISQFIVKIRNMEDVLGVTFTNATAEEKLEDEDEGELHNFNMNVVLNTGISLSDLQLQLEEQLNGENNSDSDSGEASENEVN